MALIKCPDCARDVSDQAPACPNCGRPIAARPSGMGDPAARAAAETVAQFFRDRWLDGQNRSNRSRPKRYQQDDFWLWKDRGTQAVVGLASGITPSQVRAISDDGSTRGWLEVELLYTLLLAGKLDRNEPTRQDMEIWLMTMNDRVGSATINRAVQRVGRVSSVVDFKQPKRFGLF